MLIFINVFTKCANLFTHNIWDAQLCQAILIITNILHFSCNSDITSSRVIKTSLFVTYKHYAVITKARKSQYTYFVLELNIIFVLTCWHLLVCKMLLQSWLQVDIYLCLFLWNCINCSDTPITNVSHSANTELSPSHGLSLFPILRA